MSKIMRLEGALGGSDAATTAVPVEAPNTLQSRATARLVELIGEGEMWGLVDGAASIYLDQTPVQASDGTFNFANFDWDQRFGTADQPPILGFPEIEDVVSVNTNVTTLLPCTRHVSNPLATSLKLTIQFGQGLYTSDASGNVNGGQVEWTVDVRPLGGTWVTVSDDSVIGKTLSPYDKQVKVFRPTTLGIWEWRVNRLTPDDVDDSSHTMFSVLETTEIVDQQHSYPNTALVGLAIDAQSTGGSIPVRAYDVRGMFVRVPANYQPYDEINNIAPTYSGPWDGTFVIAYTSNPVWCLYHMLVSPRFGMGDLIDATQIDKFSFYDVANYCDEMVDDAKGGLEPRFTLNVQIATTQNSWQLLQAMASNCRSVLIGGGSIIRLVCDMPQDPVSLFTKSDIIGKFSYQSTAKQDRFNAAIVTYNEPLNFFNATSVSEQNDDAIAAQGYNPTQITAYGCTSERQARLMAKWAIDTSLNQTQTVMFQSSLNRSFASPGDVVEVFDEDYAQSTGGGRILASSTATTINLDRPVVLASGTTYVITIISSNATTLEKRTVIDAPGTYTSLNVDVAFGNPPIAGHTWVLAGVVAARPFKIIAVKESARGIYDFSGVIYDSTKFARVELGIVLTQQQFTIASTAVTPVTAVTFTPESVTINGVAVPRLHVSWTPPSSGSSGISYIVKSNVNNGVVTQSAPLNSPDFYFDNVQNGEYTVTIYAVPLIGNYSLATTASYIIESGTLNPDMAACAGLEIVGGGTTFATPDMMFEWTDPNVASLSIVPKDYQVIVSVGGTVASIFYVPVPTTNFAYTFSQNTSDGGPFRSLSVEVRLRDVSNNVSPPIAANFTNAPEAAPTFTLSATADTATVTITSTPETDHLDYLVFRSLNPTFDAAGSTLVAQSAASSIVIPSTGGNSWYFRVAGIDNFGTNGMIASLPQVIFVPPSTTGTVTSIGLTSTDLSITGSPVTAAGDIDVELLPTGVSAGTYTSLSVDLKGRVTAATNPTTLAGYGITDALTAANDLSDVLSAVTARSNLGLGSIATQDATAVAISGGSITGLPTPTAPSDAVTKAYADSLAFTGLTAIANDNLLANISGGSAAPTATTLTGLIDSAIGATQGGVLYRDATTWMALSPGTSGQYLQTQGASANPQWASVSLSGGGTVTSVGVTSTDLAVSGSPITTTGNITLDLNTSGATAGTYKFLTINAKGIVTAGSNTPPSTSYTVTTSTQTISPTSADVILVALQANCTFTIAAGVDGQPLRLRLTQDGTGSRTVAFDSSVGFGTDITGFVASTAPNKVDYVTLIYSAPATKWHLAAATRGY